MKHLMLCTFSGGGASIAAKRQAEALRRAGHQCHFAYIEQGNVASITVDRRENEIVIKVPHKVWHNHINTSIEYCKDNRTPISNTLFTFWHISTYWDNILLNICKEYAVIHMHWVAWMVSSTFLQRLSFYNVRVVITNHDMNFFTGGCHYSAGCSHYVFGCSNCPQLRDDALELVANSYREKLSAVAALRATWLFPSLWLAESFKKSRTWSADTSVQVLHNCIDTDRFTPVAEEQRNLLRQEFGFRPDEIVLVAGASDMSEVRKGFDVIARAVEDLRDASLSLDGENTFVTVVTFGINKSFFDSHAMRVRHVHLGKIHEDTVIRLFQASDLLLFPSSEENFANTIIESLMCACPVLAFRVGGVPDIVVDGTNGWLVDEISHAAFSKKMQSVLRPGRIKHMRSSTKAWRDRHATTYGYEQGSRALARVYGNRDCVSKPCVPAYDEPAQSLSELYKVLFSARACEQVMAQASLSSVPIRQVRFALGEAGATPGPRFPRAIPVGFDHAERSKTLGDICWLHKEAYLLFRGKAGMRPALCLQIPNEKWVIDLYEQVKQSLVATCNGDNVELVAIDSNPRTQFLYLWLVPRPASLVSDSFNKLSIYFTEYAVPLTKDARGLCLLYSKAFFVDLNACDIETKGNAPDTSFDSALMSVVAPSLYEISLKGDLDGDWRPVNNLIETWLDVL